MPNYPNWKRKLAQTQFSLGSNPRLGTTLPNKISKRQRILGILTYRKDYTGMRPRYAICDSHYAPVPEQAYGTGSEPVVCGFDSREGHLYGLVV